MATPTTTATTPTTEAARILPIRPALYERLSALAAREGRPIEQVADELLAETLARHEGSEYKGSEADLDRPHAGMTFAELLAPLAEDFKATGMTDEELGEFIDGQIAAHRAERRDRANTQDAAHEGPPAGEPLIILGEPEQQRSR